MHYYYTGNLLDSVSVTVDGVDVVTSGRYKYDSNGNMTHDGYSGVDIEYNELDLPKRIFAGSNEVRYIYAADGQKLAMIADGSLTYYRGVMVYDQNGELSYMLHPEGVITRQGSSGGSIYTYNYFKTDHVGSTRVVLAALKQEDGSWTLQLLQNTDYYPYGLAWDGDIQNLDKNKYLFGGKELQDAAVGSLGAQGLPSPDALLGLYDFHARYYNPMLGRWFNQDPAHQCANPYSYCGNSPMMYVDPTGTTIKWWQVVTGMATLIDPISVTTTLTVGAGSLTGMAGTVAGVDYATAIANMPMAASAGVFGENDWGARWEQMRGRIKNVWKIANGFFQTDADLSYGKRAWQLFSRQTWEQPFTNNGYLFQNALNFVSHADVDYFHGATVMRSDLFASGQGMTLGGSITISYDDGDIDYDNTTLLHEYGHYMQARGWGGVSMMSMSMFSFGSASFDWRSTGPYMDSWSEMDANSRSRRYFGNRLEDRQKNKFSDSVQSHFGYYDSRFWRSYLFPGLLPYWIYDVTWSK